MNLREIPKSELSVMSVVWREEAKGETKVNSRKLTDALQEVRGWQRTTTLTILSRLVEKGFLEVDKSKRLSRYASIVKHEEYAIFITKKFMSDIFDNSKEKLLNVIDQI